MSKSKIVMSKDLGDNRTAEHHIRSGSEQHEWYTPGEIIDLAHTVMGGIDLDPASCREANENVGAESYYTKDNDGLAHHWFGRVFLNPPYGKGDKTGRWYRKLVKEYEAGRVTQAMFLANAIPDTRWFHHAVAHHLVLITKGRLSFWRPGVDSRKGLLGSALVYFAPLDVPLDRPQGSSPGGPVMAVVEAFSLRRFIDAAAPLGQIVMSVG